MINWFGWQSFSMILLILSLLTYSIGLRLGGLVAAAFAYFAFSAVRVFAWPGVLHAGISPLLQLQFDMASCRMLAEFLLVAITALITPKEVWLIFWRVIAAVNAGTLIFGRGFELLHIRLSPALTHAFEPVIRPLGLMINSSMSGCLSACLAPLLPRYEAIFAICGALVSARHMPYACIGALILYWLWRNCRPAFTPAALICALVATGLWNSNHRSEVWRLSYDWFKANGNLWFGTGGGTFGVIGPMITKDTGSIWFWAHNDWLQIALEQGIVGVSLALTVWARAVRNSRVRLSLLAYGVWACGNMPLHYDLSMLLGAYLLISANLKESEASSKAYIRYPWRWSRGF